MGKKVEQNHYTFKISVKQIGDRIDVRVSINEFAPDWLKRAATDAVKSVYHWHDTEGKKAA